MLLHPLYNGGNAMGNLFDPSSDASVCLMLLCVSVFMSDSVSAAAAVAVYFFIFFFSSIRFDVILCLTMLELDNLHTHIYII